MEKTNYLYNGVSLKNNRPTNMDSLLIRQKSINGKNVLIAAVCDGVGSLQNGDYASGKSAQMLNDWLEKTKTTDRIGLKMRDTIIWINNCILSEAEEKNIETASTLSALLIAGQYYYIAHIGDSRVYCYEDGRLFALTNDDISESGKLCMYIGKSRDIFPQYYEGFAAGKTFLVCSDGLYKRMDTDFLAEKLKACNKKTIKELTKSLPLYVMERGERDNISFAAVKIEGYAIDCIK